MCVGPGIFLCSRLCDISLTYFVLLGGQITEVRPKVTLVVRMAASVANYDYIVDWEFQTDGLIRIKVSLYTVLSD